MSTNARIWVKIDPQDYGKTLKADVSKLPLKLAENNFPMVDVKIDPKPVAPLYIGVYVHYDGYFKGGVGETLCNHFKTYEQALNLVLLGDLSYVAATDGICSYHNSDNETFHAVKVQYDKDTFYNMLQQASHYSYEYVFENDKWTTVRWTFEDTFED